jgi:formylglycine-generating enzyme required for sulfatase activity
VLLLGLSTLSGAVAQISIPSGRPQVASIKAGVVKIVTAPGSKTGTGIVVRRDPDEAWIATAMHVVSNADKISVLFQGAGKSWTAEAKNIEFDNPAQGLALLRVAGQLPAEVIALPLATDLAVSGGEQVNVIGHQPSTGDWGVLTGTISGRKGRELVIQVPIQEQTSGGPVIVNGRVVGLVQRRDPSGQFGYAVTAQAIKEYVDGNQVSLAAAPSTPPPPPPREQQPAAPVASEKRSPPTASAGETFRDCGECPEMVVIPAGTFMMGSRDSEVGRSKDEGPQHKVTIARPFAVSRYEITFDEWDACMKEGGCKDMPKDEGWGRGMRPVINVNWDNAQNYAAWLAKKTGKPYRLLSEAEWEYAARGGTTTRYPWGDEPGTNRANFGGSGSQWSGKQTAPVGSFEPNAFGLHDMIGNVWEWVEDCWNENYRGAPVDGSAWGSGDCGLRVVRGGSWFIKPEDARVAYRYWGNPTYRSNFQGFRLARTL